MKKTSRIRPAVCAALALLLCFAAGCSGAERETVGICGGDPILREEYDYLAARLEAGLSEEQIREQVTPALIEDRAILAAARALLDGLTPEDSAVQKAVDAGLEDAKKTCGGKSEFRAMLRERNLTEHHFRRLLAIAELQRLTQEKLFAGTELDSTSDFAAWLKNPAHHARAERYVFSTRADAEKFLSVCAAGRDPDAAVGDCGGEKRKAGDFFLGLGTEAEDAAVFGLPEDGATLSPVTETGDSCTVFRRLPVSDTAREDVAAMQGLAVRDRLRDVKWNALLDEYRDQLTVSWTKDGQNG